MAAPAMILVRIAAALTLAAIAAASFSITPSASVAGPSVVSGQFAATKDCCFAVIF